MISIRYWCDIVFHRDENAMKNRYRYDIVCPLGKLFEIPGYTPVKSFWYEESIGDEIFKITENGSLLHTRCITNLKINNFILVFFFFNFILLRFMKKSLFNRAFFYQLN